MPEQRREEVIDGQLVSTIDGWYEMLAKDEDGVPQVFRLERHSTKTRPLPEGVENPFITQAPEMRITPSRAKRAERVGQMVVGVIPDEQIGYRYINGEFVPTHDEKALEAARRVLKLMKPDLIVAVGDTADFPNFSKYPADSNHFIPDTVQKTIDRIAQWDAELAADHPDIPKVRLAGNHDQRLSDYVLKNAKDVHDLRRAGENWPVLSLAYLTRAEETGWNYITPYGASFEVGNTLFTHGDVVRSNGSTAEAMSKRYPYSNVVFGHVHRFESHKRTTPDGDYLTAVTFGTLARIDGAVPSVGNLVDAGGEIVTRMENWQQGLGQLTLFANGVMVAQEIPIHDGKAYTSDGVI